MATLTDIAAKAGVPKSAVSYVLRGKAAEGRIGAARAQHIREVAQELGYRPNAFARAVSTGKFHAAAMLYRRSGNGVPANLVKGLLDVLEPINYHLNFSQITQSQFDQQKLMPKSLRELCVDGVAGYHELDIPPRVAEVLRDLRIPTIWLNADTGADCVYPDDRRATDDAATRLIELGHRRIAMVEFHAQARPPRNGHYSGQARRGGYADAMRRAGLTPRVETQTWPPDAEGRPMRWGEPGDDRLDRARALLTGPDRPTAVVTADPSAAEPIAIAALTLGLDLPRDLSLVTVSYNPVVRLGLAISTLALPLMELGHHGAKALLAKIENPARELPGQPIPFEPPVGRTIGPPPDLDRHQSPSRRPLNPTGGAP